MPFDTATQKTAVKIRVLTQNDNRLSLSASVPGQFLCAGMAVFVIQADGSLVCELLHVDKGCRRQGIASALFDHAENHLQISAVSGLQLTPDGVDFYKGRGIAVPTNAVIKSFNEWFDAA